MAKKNRKISAQFRKNRTPRARPTDWTKRFQEHGFAEEAPAHGERVGKDELSRRRTVMASDDAVGDAPSEISGRLDVDEATCLRGRVLRVFGLMCSVQAEDGRLFQCATRRILKTLSTDQRHVVAAGDRVLLRTVSSSTQLEGIIERVEPRTGTVTRNVKGRQHTLVANVDQVLIVTSAAEPRLKPNLIDRMLITAEKGRIRPIICINKTDLVDVGSLMPLVGNYSRMGYPVLMTSAESGFGIDRIRRALGGHASVVAGQSGVGKSSLLNVVDPGLDLAVAEVSRETEKGRHTTTTARLLPLSFGGWVVDTPGVKQFQLWDVIREEVAGFYRDLRPYVSLCKFPNCTHTHEDDCAIKDAVADGRLDERRYESYCGLFAGDME
jgi:ribosome biogenesis GTPase / thiamine phosphate phosphatase